MIYLVNHFIQKYGAKEVLKWNFETWNEPDHKIYANFTKESYLNYLKFTFEGLKTASQKIVRIGGPGGSCQRPHFNHLCETFFEFLNENNIKPNYISFHRKGNNDVDSIIQDEIQTTLPYLNSILNKVMMFELTTTDIIFWISLFSGSCSILQHWRWS